MANKVLRRITEELTEIGHAVTSYEELGLDFDEQAVATLSEVVGKDVYGEQALQLVENTENTTNMIIAQGADTLRLGTDFVRPVIETLFAGSPRTLGKWALYAINRYEAGGTFEPHMDSVGASVVVASISGVREMDIYKREADQLPEKPETYRVVERTLELYPGVIVILDGQLDPPHAVRCIEPSLSAVIDVPDLLRPPHLQRG